MENETRSLLVGLYRLDAEGNARRVAVSDDPDVVEAVRRALTSNDPERVEVRRLQDDLPRALQALRADAWPLVALLVLSVAMLLLGAL